MSELGNLITEYKENETAMNSTLLIGLVCFVLSVMMAVFFFGEKGISFNKFLFAFGGLASFGGGIGCVHSFWKNSGGRVELHENGLLVEKGGKQHRAVWDEIAVVKEKVEKIIVNGSHIYDRYLYTIEKNNKETFELSNMVSNIDQIGRAIREKTFERLYPQAVEKISGGGQVMFDSLSVDANGLGGIPWAELSSVKVKEGIIEIKDKNAKVVVNGSYGATPNAHLLIALLKEHLTIE